MATRHSEVLQMKESESAELQDLSRAPSHNKDLEQGQEPDDTQSLTTVHSVEEGQVADSAINTKDHAITGSDQFIPLWIRLLRLWNLMLFYHGFGTILLGIPLLIPLVLIAQRKPFDNQRCAARARVDQCGFEGNEDAYGLGIRLGIYLQWIIPWIRLFLVQERDERPFTATSTTFSAALLVAMLVLTFGENCTYSIEMIIMLFFIVTSQALVSFAQTTERIIRNAKAEAQATYDPESAPSPLERVNSVARSNSTPPFGIHGWFTVATVVNYLALVYATWFWILMAGGNSDTFTETPCGTTVFVLGPVREGIHIFSGFIAAFCSTMLVYQMCGWILTKFVSEKVGQTANTCLTLIVLLPALLPGLLFLIARAIVLEMMGREYDFAGQHKNTIGACAGASVIMISIAGIELTLFWNKVSNVYSVGSTGQLIPLSVGLVTFLPLIWGLFIKIVSEIAASVKPSKDDSRESSSRGEERGSPTGPVGEPLPATNQ